MAILMERVCLKWLPFDDKKNARMILGDVVEMGPGLTETQMAFFQAWYDQQTKR